jgi:hypothetical protein
MFLIAGLVANLLGLVWAIHVAGLLTSLSGMFAWMLIRETAHKAPTPGPFSMKGELAN